MARTVKHAKLDSRTARSRLKTGRQPHWAPLVPNCHLGYQRYRGDSAGRWLLRRYLGGGNRYSVVGIGLADDSDAANGTTILDHAQADAKARAMAATPAVGSKIINITVRQAVSIYVEHKRHQGQPVADVQGRAKVHILPALGDHIVSELTSDRLQRWLFEMMDAPAQKRAKDGKPQFYPPVADNDEEGKRRRKATSNRVLTILKAVLNHAYDKGHVSNRDAWGRKLKPFKGVNAARVRFLTVEEAQRFVNACDAEFRPLARAALESGARYSELARLEVADFNPDAGTLAIRKSKTSKARHIILTQEGIAFFKRHCIGRSGLMFTHKKQRSHGDEQAPWLHSEQNRPMAEANKGARLKPRISFHGLRHTWASLAVMNGVPLMVVARNLGHTDTRMVERHYGHLAPSYIVDAIRAGAPRYGIKEKSNVKALR
jgi:integrase